jgi:2-dehydropantoate 2-reductase
MDNAKVLVIGAGVNGSAVALELFKAGVEVSLLARGSRYEELCAQGVVIENPFNGKRSQARVPVINALGADERYDYILVCVRKNQALELLPLLAQNVSPNIVFMGNNLAGADEFMRALGRERVMMGAVFAAGRREGAVIRAMVIKSVASPFGELDGSRTPRLERLMALLRRAGFKVEASENIVESQRTHGVGVALIALLAYKHGGKVAALGRARDDLYLYSHAWREAHQVLHATGHPVVPASEGWIARLPAFITATAMRWLLCSHFGEVGLEYHLSQAPDEMRQLALELRALVEQSGLPVPAVREVLGLLESNGTLEK